jgi:hypothetical protein
MAVVTTKSTIIANRDSSPSVLTDPQISGGMPRDAMGFAQVSNGDSIGSMYPLTQVPSNSRLSALSVACDAITGAAANVGVYNPTKNGVAGAVINASFFAAAQSLATAIPSGVSILNQSGLNTIPKQEQQLWQALGLAADPGGMLDIVVTLTAAATATGFVSLRAVNLA